MPDSTLHPSWRVPDCPNRNDFRNKGIRVCDDEREAYSQLSGILQVSLQPNAWALEEVSLNWLDEFHKDAAHLRES